MPIPDPPKRMQIYPSNRHGYRYCTARDHTEAGPGDPYVHQPLAEAVVEAVKALQLAENDHSPGWREREQIARVDLDAALHAYKEGTDA